MADYYSELPPEADYERDRAKPGSRDFAIISWADDRMRRGQRFLEAQAGFDRIDQTIGKIFGEEKHTNVSYVPTPKPMSRTRANLIAKIGEDLTAMLTDTRVFWSYRTSNGKYEPQCRNANKRADHWWTSRMIDLRVADIIRYWATCGTGFAHLYYSKQLDDMMVEAVDPRNVIPINPISYHTTQDCMGVILRLARTPEWVYDEYHKRVQPDSGTESIFGWFYRTLTGAAKKVGGPLSKRNKADDQVIPATPTVFVNTLYIKDRRTNERSTDIYMGDWDEDGKPKNTWSYIVKPGQPLYPFNRMIVWGGGALLYDGPAPYWHAQFPLIKLTLNPWPQSWLGKAPLWDLITLNDSLNSLLQVIDDHAAQVAQPGATADRNVSRAEFDKFNTRVAGYKIRTNMASGKGITIQNPPPLDPELWKQIDWIENTMRVLSGTADMSQIAQLNQLPSNDTIDTIMKAMTPGNRLRSRILEGFIKELAQQFLWCIFQFDTLTKRLTILGPGGVTPEDFDYDPGTMIPDDVPDGDPGDVASAMNALTSEGPRPIFDRARDVIQSIAFGLRPGSLLNSAAQQSQLEDFMLSKMGYLSVFTLWDNLGRMNFAPAEVPDGNGGKKPFVLPASELERLQMQQALGIGMIANAQGRKATDAAPPSLQMGGNGPTLTTS